MTAIDSCSWESESPIVMSLTPLTLETGPIVRRQWHKRQAPWQDIRNDDAATSFILLDIFGWILTYFSGQGPSVLTKSPIEHWADKQNALNNLPYDKRCRMRYREVTGGEIPNGHVRVRFFNSIKEVARSAPLLTAVVALEPSGSLDIRKLKAMWGLESCSIVDPYRFKLFVPQNEEFISPLAVNDLYQYYNAINIVEPNVSRSTLRRRQIRMNLLRPLSRYMSSKQDSCITWLRKNTEIIDWAEELQRDVYGSIRYAGRCLEGWAAENYPDLIWLWESITLSGILTMVFMFYLWKFSSPSM